jgi:hypothetical protein
MNPSLPKIPVKSLRSHLESVIFAGGRLILTISQGCAAPTGTEYLANNTLF